MGADAEAFADGSEANGGFVGRWLARRGWDIDEVFAYETVKIVRVRDFKLGVLYYSFQIAILLYLIIYGIVISKGYLRLEQIQTGSIVLNTEEPANRSLPVDIPYCCDDNNPCSTNNTLLPCLYWDQYQAEYPVGKEYSAAITSRLSVYSQVANCSDDQFFADCSYEPSLSAAKNAGNSYFVAAAEQFTLRIRHGVRGSVVNRVGTNTGTDTMSGKLGDLRHWPDDTPFAGVSQNETRTGDIVTFKELLQASGLTMEDLTATGDSVRYDGINIIVFIKYSMVGRNHLRYTYEPRALSDAEFKVEEVIHNGTTRTIFNRHGVRFLFVQIGEIGEFDFLVLMTTLVTGLALLAVATTITNLLMTMIMPMRKVYQKHKYEITEDFSYWRAMSQADAEQRMDSLNDRPSTTSFHTLATDTHTTSSET